MMEEINDMNYLEKVKEQLTKMTSDQKDAWILSQSMLISDNKQKDFLMSLSGEKRIIDMPSLNKIDSFCRQVETGEIFLEYETHYYEFDDEGRYMDNWEVWYNDPFAIIPMIDKIFDGCHRLVRLEEYEMVLNLLNRIFELRFSVEESENTEDCSEDEWISLSTVNDKGMLTQDLSRAGADWIKSFTYLTKGKDIRKCAQRLIEMFGHSVCQKLKPRMLIEYGVSQELYSVMEKMLKEEIADVELLKEKISVHGYSTELYDLKNALNRKNELLLDIRLKCLKIKTDELKLSKPELEKS